MIIDEISNLDINDIFNYITGENISDLVIYYKEQSSIWLKSDINTMLITDKGTIYIEPHINRPNPIHSNISEYLVYKRNSKFGILLD